MSDVNGVNNSSNVFTSLNKTDEVETESTSDMFMQLMIANLKNQDPTNPTDTAQYMEQISNMTMVEGVTNLNTTMESLNTSLLSSQSALQASSLVGQMVYVKSDTASADAATGTIKGVLELDTSASNVSVSVFDSAGSLVDTIPLGAQAAGDVQFDWQLEEGMLLDGYSFGATAVVDGQSTAIDVFTGMNVNSVTLGQNGVGMKINTDAGSVSLSEIKQIGE